MQTNEEGREALRDEYRHRAAPLDEPAADVDDTFFPVPSAGADDRPNRIDEDVEREAGVDQLLNEPARPLTDEEREAAKRDPGRPERVYAPRSERVPKQPFPGDEKLIKRD